MTASLASQLGASALGALAVAPPAAAAPLPAASVGGSIVSASVAKSVVFGLLLIGATSGGAWALAKRLNEADRQAQTAMTQAMTQPTAAAAAPDGASSSIAVTSTPRGASPSAAPVVEVEPVPNVATRGIAPPPRGEAPVAKETPTSASMREGSLREEVSSLRDVELSLQRGEGASALDKLDDLAARHPEGALREERMAARVLALCAAGKLDEAEQAGRAFVSEMPNSMYAERVRTSCAFGRPATEGPAK
jgi:hypothetical protein